MDLTRDVTYRGFVLNDGSIGDATTGGGAIATGISGCQIDTVAYGDVDVVQYSEKRSQSDGMDVGDVLKGVRRLRMAGTLYGITRALLFDQLDTLRAALDPVLAQREEPGDKGYRPLYFSQPTNRIDDYPTATIDLRILAMPRAFDWTIFRNQQGGDDGNALAIPWQATLICRDPSVQSAGAVDTDFDVQTEVTTGVTITAATNLVSKIGHGLVAGDRVRFTSLTGGTGLSTSITYYVIAGGLTANAFAVSLTSGGAAVDVTVNYTSAKYVKSLTVAGDLNNRGTYLSQLNALFVVGAASGQISATIGDSIFTITIPASTGARTIRFKGEDKVLTLEEDGVETPRYDLLTFATDTTWPLMDSGSSAYSFTFHGGILATGSHFWFYERYA